MDYTNNIIKIKKKIKGVIKNVYHRNTVKEDY